MTRKSDHNGIKGNATMTKLPDCDHLCNSSSLQREKQPEERNLAIFAFVVLFVVIFVFVFVYTDSGTKNSVPRQNKS